MSLSKPLTTPAELGWCKFQAGTTHHENIKLSNLNTCNNSVLTRPATGTMFTSVTMFHHCYVGHHIWDSFHGCDVIMILLTPFCSSTCCKSHVCKKRKYVPRTTFVFLVRIWLCFSCPTIMLYYSAIYLLIKNNLIAGN